MGNENLGSDSAPRLPERGQRMVVSFAQGTHPAIIPPDELLSQCDSRFQRRSGPGGQHRNKTSSGVFLHHQPTGVTCEATERRSQAKNRSIALTRLRFRLAVEVRTESPIDAPVDAVEAEIRQRYHGKPLRISDTNDAKPAVVALLLNDLHAAGGQPSLVAPLWSATTSGVVGFIKSHPPAFTLLNAIREHHQRGPLR